MQNSAIDQIKLSEDIQVSVVIPHFSSSREENLKGLLDELRAQTFQAVEIIIVRGISPQGRAINQGARLAKGEILVVMDDDSRMGSPRVIENLVKVIRQDPSIAMAGASIQTSEEANAFQKVAARQFPRFSMPMVREIIDSDLPCHGCVAFRKEIFMKVGMEREHIIRGLDPDLRVRFRKGGYRVVLVPDTVVYHPLPGSFFKFIRLFFRNGYGSAYLQVFYPEINYDTDESLGSQSFVPKRSFLYRAFRFPVRLGQSLLRLEWFRFLGYFVYVFGYLAGFLQFAVIGRLQKKLHAL